MPPTPTGEARWPWVILVISIAAASLGFVFIVLRGEPLLGDVANFLAFMSMGVVGALVLSRDSANRIGMLLLFVACAIGSAFATSEAAVYLLGEGDLAAARWTSWPGTVLWIVGFPPLLILLPLLFPDGKLPSRRWRPVLWVGTFAWSVGLLAVSVGQPSFEIEDGLRPIANPLHVRALEPLAIVAVVVWPVLLLLFLLGVASMIFRFRRSSGVERQQLKWFAFAASVVAVHFVISFALDALEIAEGEVGQVLSGVIYLGLPIAVGVSILRYRLWDLDVVVKKTFVAGTLVLLAVFVYGATVLLIPTIVELENPVFLFAVALALGVAFRPVMRFARRVADRLVYGRRATPYEVLTEFSERVGTSYATEDVLPRMAQVLGEGTGAEVARVWFRVAGEFRPAAAWPADAPAVSTIAAPDGLDLPDESVTEVRDKGDLLGALSVRMPASDPMSPSKEKLVKHLAAQAGLVLRNVRLVEDVRASRQRLVAAQDEERRRLERNIHDGAQQQLVALAVKARLARQLTEREPAKAAEILGQIEAETQVALEDLRDLARGIYPPLLADRGLVAALEAQSRKASVAVSVEADAVGRYPADVEATVYFCTLEALQNVAKYAAARRTVIRLVRANGSLSFEVEDDGQGFDPSATGTGSGLQGMADRLAAVGGSLEVRSVPGRGTTVAGHVPVTAG
jgi:signal transduction histidine kinase